MSHATTMSHARRGLLAGALLAIGAACSDRVTTPDGGARAPVTITATLTAEQQALIAGMSVEVTGSGITTPIVVTLSVSGATVNGTVQVPVGGSRTFTVRAFDAEGRETHTGSATAAVVAGTNPPLVVRMTAVEGSVPIDVTIGSYGVTLTPATASVAVDQSVTLTANVTTNGTTASGPLTWGVVNPALVTLTVAGDGRSAVVRGRLAGTTRVVASYEGVAAASTVTISDAPPANQPPVARTNGAFSNVVGGSIGFSSAGSNDPDGTIVSYLWSFGDGTTSTQANPAKAYSAAGTYTVRLTVTDDDGAAATAYTSAVISAAPTGNLALYAIDAGTSHTCGLASGGAVWCWGDNTYGQLGNGTTTSSAQPVRASVPNLEYAIIRAGRAHTCAVTTMGNVYCWGDNSWGQLGDGTTTSRPTPASIATSTAGTSFLTNSLSGGDDHLCGKNSLDGAMYCWGRNDDGQVGGTSAIERRAVRQGDPPTGYSWQQMAAGGRHSCGVFFSSGTNSWGTLCRGGGKSGSIGTFTTPLSTISAGAEFTCGLQGSTGTGLWCWGDNTAGQLGRGTVSASEAPAPVSITLARVDAGRLHACGSTSGSSGTGHCWGDNSHGQLGDGTTTQRSAPVTVSGGSMTGITAGARHSCGLRAGNAYCWGDNTSGQLGDGTRTARLVPTTVVAGVVPNQAPTVSIPSEFVGRAGQSVTISASGTDPDGTIASYIWAFSDQASPTSTTTGSITRTFTTAGTYQVSVAVTDDRGAISPSKSAIIRIDP